MQGDSSCDTPGLFHSVKLRSFAHVGANSFNFAQQRLHLYGMDRDMCARRSASDLRFRRKTLPALLLRKA